MTKRHQIIAAAQEAILKSISDLQSQAKEMEVARMAMIERNNKEMALFLCFKKLLNIIELLKVI